MDFPLPIRSVSAVDYSIPLHVDTAIVYTLDEEKFPGLNDISHRREPALILASTKCQDFNAQESRVSCEPRDSSESLDEAQTDLYNLIDTLEIETFQQAIPSMDLPDLPDESVSFDSCAPEIVEEIVSTIHSCQSESYQTYPQAEQFYEGFSTSQTTSCQCCQRNKQGFRGSTHLHSRPMSENQTCQRVHISSTEEDRERYWQYINCRYQEAMVKSKRKRNNSGNCEIRDWVPSKRRKFESSSFQVGEFQWLEDFDHIVDNVMVPKPCSYTLYHNPLSLSDRLSVFTHSYSPLKRFTGRQW